MDSVPRCQWFLYTKLPPCLSRYNLTLAPEACSTLLSVYTTRPLVQRDINTQTLYTLLCKSIDTLELSSSEPIFTPISAALVPEVEPCSAERSTDSKSRSSSPEPHQLPAVHCAAHEGRILAHQHTLSTTCNISIHCEQHAISAYTVNSMP